MQQEEIKFSEVMVMANSFSGYKIAPKYFPDMLNSSVIMESLKDIYILHHNQKFNEKDALEIKQLFHEYFNFFCKTTSEIANTSIEVNNNQQKNKKYNKKYLSLFILFFSLFLFSGVGCAYSLFFVAVVVVIFTFLLYSYLNIPIDRPCPLENQASFDKDNVQEESVEEENVEEYKDKLFALKYNLNQLRNSLVDKYQIKTVNDFFKHRENALSDPKILKHSVSKKKTVSFAPKLSVFFEENIEVRLHINSYDSSEYLYFPG